MTKPRSKARRVDGWEHRGFAPWRRNGRHNGQDTGKGIDNPIKGQDRCAEDPGQPADAKKPATAPKPEKAAPSKTVAKSAAKPVTKAVKAAAAKTVTKAAAKAVAAAIKPASGAAKPASVKKAQAESPAPAKAIAAAKPAIKAATTQTAPAKSVSAKSAPAKAAAVKVAPCKDRVCKERGGQGRICSDFKTETRVKACSGGEHQVESIGLRRQALACELFEGRARRDHQAPLRQYRRVARRFMQALR